MIPSPNKAVASAELSIAVSKNTKFVCESATRRRNDFSAANTRERSPRIPAIDLCIHSASLSAAIAASCAAALTLKGGVAAQTTRAISGSEQTA